MDLLPSVMTDFRLKAEATRLKAEATAAALPWLPASAGRSARPLTRSVAVTIGLLTVAGFWILYAQRQG